VLISVELNKALNEQIGHELGACLQYLSIAGYFEQQKLKLLANLFFKQSDEEKEHALKFVHYVLDTKGELKIPAIPAPTPAFATAEAAVAAALKWEEEVTGQINALMDLAGEKNLIMVEAYLVHIDKAG
jgi:ferritin